MTQAQTRTPAVSSGILPSIPPRPADGHKGTFGKVIVIGGSPGMSGSISLSSVAALRSGSGLVTAIVPKSIQSIVAGYEPSLMTIGMEEDSAEGLLPVPLGRLTEMADGKDAIGCGPGLGQSAAAVQLTRDLLQNAACPLVLDADALNVVAEHGLISEKGLCQCVITPHPGEFSRLTGMPIAEIESQREEHAMEYARRHNVIVVLKGPGTVVTDGHRCFVNNTGNSGMATGGSGDVLTGIVTSLLGQRMPAFEAAAIAVHVHGLAGDIAADKLSERGMIASDILKFLPDAWKKLESR